MDARRRFFMRVRGQPLDCAKSRGMACMPVAQTESFVIPANEYRRERWRNGLGWTREILQRRIDDAPASDAAPWDWRLSIAEIERDAAFSAFPGIDRELVLLAGNGVRLRFADAGARAASAA
jgi:uncharacterized protein